MTFLWISSISPGKCKHKTCHKTLRDSQILWKILKDPFNLPWWVYMMLIWVYDIYEVSALRVLEPLQIFAVRCIRHGRYRLPGASESWTSQSSASVQAADGALWQPFKRTLLSGLKRPNHHGSSSFALLKWSFRGPSHFETNKWNPPISGNHDSSVVRPEEWVAGMVGQNLRSNWFTESFRSI